VIEDNLIFRIVHLFYLLISMQNYSNISSTLDFFYHFNWIIKIF